MISSAADFGNPLVLGGENDVLSTEIYFSIAGAQLDFAKASALGLPSFKNSLLYAFLAAPLMTMIGVLMAYIITRKQFWGRGFVDFCTVLIFAVPGTVIGIAYILAFNTPPVELSGTAVILIITMAIRAMPVGIRGCMSALSQISTSLDEASQLQRSGSLKTIRSVLLPLLTVPG